VLKKLVQIALLGAAINGISLNPSSAEMLITEAEARLPKQHDAGVVSRGITRGPGIEQLAPPADRQINSPFPLRIKFQSRNMVEIDPASIRLTYLTAPPVDLTERVRKYVSTAGIELAQAEVPPGVHVLRVELKDRQGRTSSAVVRLTVAEK
jgi:hypothetical protein